MRDEILRKTDVEGVYSMKPGVLIVDRKDNYDALRHKALEERRQHEKINNLENRISSIESLLKQILEKV